jgi:hypothetical protein
MKIKYDEIIMNKERAISTIDKCSGFSEETSSVGEAWKFVQDYIERLEESMVIYAREKIIKNNFESDQDVIEYFLKFYKEKDY